MSYGNYENWTLFFYPLFEKKSHLIAICQVFCDTKNVLTFGQLNKTNRANWVTNEFTRTSVFLKSLFRVTKWVLESATSLSEKNVFILGKEFQYLPLYKLKWIWEKKNSFFFNFFNRPQYGHICIYLCWGSKRGVHTVKYKAQLFINQIQITYLNEECTRWNTKHN